MLPGLAVLQAFAGIVTVSVGHCHPEVVAAVNRQNQLLQHTTTIYLNNEIAEYAKELADKMPGNLKVGSWGQQCTRQHTAHCSNSAGMTVLGASNPSASKRAVTAFAVGFCCTLMWGCARDGLAGGLAVS